jgi:hypothetical protein
VLQYEQFHSMAIVMVGMEGSKVHILGLFSLHFGVSDYKKRVFWAVLC